MPVSIGSQKKKLELYIRNDSCNSTGDILSPTNQIPHSGRGWGSRGLGCEKPLAIISSVYPYSLGEIDSGMHTYVERGMY